MVPLTPSPQFWHNYSVLAYAGGMERFVETGFMKRFGAKQPSSRARQELQIEPIRVRRGDLLAQP